MRTKNNNNYYSLAHFQKSSIENAPRLTSIERNAFANLTRLRVV